MYYTEKRAFKLPGPIASAVGKVNRYGDLLTGRTAKGMAKNLDAMKQQLTPYWNSKAHAEDLLFRANKELGKLRGLPEEKLVGKVPVSERRAKLRRWQQEAEQELAGLKGGDNGLEASYNTLKGELGVERKAVRRARLLTGLAGVGVAGTGLGMAAKAAEFRKSAGLFSDAVATYVPEMLTGGIGAAAGQVGSLAGLVAEPEEDKNPRTSGLSFIPGVGRYKLNQRRRRSMDRSNAAGKHGTANTIAEVVGPWTSGLVGAGLGAAVTSAFDNSLTQSKRNRNMLVGAAIGAGVPGLIAAALAAVRRKRSEEEQIESDTTGRAVAKYLVPGLAEYDKYKRLGSTTHYDAKPKSVAKLNKAAAVKQASWLSMAGNAAKRGWNLLRGGNVAKLTKQQLNMERQANSLKYLDAKNELNYANGGSRAAYDSMKARIAAQQPKVSPEALQAQAQAVANEQAAVDKFNRSFNQTIGTGVLSYGGYKGYNCLKDRMGGGGYPEEGYESGAQGMDPRWLHC